MESAERSALPSEKDAVTRSVAIVGGTPRAVEFARLLDSLPGVRLVGVCPTGLEPMERFARAEGIPLAATPLEVLSVSPPPDIVLDLAEDVATRAELESALPPHTELLSGNSADLISSMARAEPAEPGRIRRLEASLESMARTNRHLETRLAEIYFMHEFVKALVAYNRVDDVSSVVVDACAGILGADLAAVYLADREAWVLRLAQSHGREADAFVCEVDVAEPVLGAAFEAGQRAEPTAVRGSAAGWLTNSQPLGMQVAAALGVGGESLGVLVLGWIGERELGSDEIERLRVVADQSALSLQNALLQAELERLSVTDRLTELFNHGYLRQRLDQEIGRAERFGHTLSVIMLDIDDFKALNDRHGHLVGDDVLRRVSALIRDNLREMDVAARYGGEEFVLIVPETDSAGALAVAERVRQSVAESALSTSEGQGVRATVSVGVATYPRDGASVDELVRSADEAMYCAKRSGKNRVAAWGEG